MDQPRMNLRDYRPGDLEPMYALDFACFGPPFRFSRPAMRRFAEAANARVVIAEHNAGLAGFCVLHIERFRTVSIGYIVTLDVAPAHRRQGVALMLMAEAEQQAFATGCHALALHVHTGNAAAIGFYQRIGFEQAGFEPDFYGRGLDAQIWRKPLTVPSASPKLAS